MEREHAGQNPQILKTFIFKMEKQEITTNEYGEASAFACEYPPLFVMVFIALVTNCNNLINIRAIEKEANKHNSKLIQLFNRIETAVTEMSQK